MSKETTPLGSSAPATGYATEVEAALALSDKCRHLPAHYKHYMRGEFECAMHTLSSEVRRLRAKEAHMWKQHAEVARLKSHNGKLSDGADAEGSK